MKSTVALSGKLAQAAKMQAAAQGQTLPEFVADAVREKVQARPVTASPAAKPGEKPWMRHYGRSAKFAGELERVKQVVEEEFEKINPDDWN